MPVRSPRKTQDSTANIGPEGELWLAADKLRNNMDAAANKRGRAQAYSRLIGAAFSGTQPH